MSSRVSSFRDLFDWLAQVDAGSRLLCHSIGVVQVSADFELKHAETGAPIGLDLMPHK